MQISPKVTASTLAAAIVTLIVWGASMAGITIPVEAQGALTTLLVFAAGYAVTDPRRS